MKTTTIDKSAWERGPWDDECDRDSWNDEATGLPCIIKRHPHSGHWCGYVGVPAGHPWNGKGYDDCGPDVHGGLTYAEKCDGDPVGGVCHVAAAGEDDAVWWLGFDCAHAWDYSGMARDAAWRRRFPREPEEVYRDEACIRAEVASLARQVVEAGAP